MTTLRSLIVLGMGFTLVLAGAITATTGAAEAPIVDEAAATWGAPVSFLPRQGDLRSVSCPTRTFCGAVDVHGGFFVRSNLDWARREQLATPLTLISCVSSTFCAGASYDGRASLFDGEAWSPAETIDSGFELAGLSCVSPTYCVAVDNGGRSVTYQGADWEVSAIGDSVLTDVSCVWRSFCMAVDAAGAVWQYDGTTWTETRDVAMNGGAGISCASTTLCAIVDNFHGVETFDGSSWSAHLQIDDATFLTDVSCVKGFCLATDELGRGFVYLDGEWTSSYSSDLLIPMKSLSCPRPWTCVAVGPTGDAASYVKGWLDPQPIDPEAGFPASLSCPDHRFCMVVDEFGTSVMHRNGSWRAAEDRSSIGFGLVSCASSAMCAALDQVGNAYTYRTREWGDPVRTALSDDISCTRLFCMAVGGHPFTSRLDGSTWSMIPIDSPRGLDSLSCPTNKLCVGIRSTGVVHTYDGTSWSAAGSRSVRFGEVSCASEQFCVAISKAGKYSVFDGSAWSSPAPSGGEMVTSLSCGGDDSCMAVTASSRALRYAAGAWTVSDVLDPEGGGFTSVSCWAADACRAVTHAGDVLTYG